MGRSGMGKMAVCLLVVAFMIFMAPGFSYAQTQGTSQDDEQHKKKPAAAVGETVAGAGGAGGISTTALIVAGIIVLGAAGLAAGLLSQPSEHPTPTPTAHTHAP